MGLPRLHSPRQSLVPVHLLTGGNESFSGTGANLLISPSSLTARGSLFGGFGRPQRSASQFQYHLQHSAGGLLNSPQAVGGVGARQPNLVSMISVNRHKDRESAAFEKEMQRQECMHEEVQEAVEKAYEEFNAIKGIAPNAYHAGHDAELRFVDLAFLFEKIVRAMDA